MKNQRLQPLQAPKIEPAYKGDYKIIAEHIKAHCAVHETYTMTSEDLLKAIPQNKRASSIASNFNKIHGLSYHRIEGEDNNDTYVFFVEPTREELMIKINELTNNLERWTNETFDVTKENNQLKPDLKNNQSNIYIAIAMGLGLGYVVTRLYLHINGL